MATSGPAAAVALDRGGEWSDPGHWPLVAIHAALDKNGNVLTYGSGPDGTGRGELWYDVWTPGQSPATGHDLKAQRQPVNLFCSLHITRPDTGNIIIMGGGYELDPHGQITQYNASTNSISKLPNDLKRERWYGTAVTRADGSIYIQGGLGGEDDAELWTPGKGSQLVPFKTTGLNWWYPRLFNLSDGRIFGVDTRGKMFFISADAKTLTRVGNLPEQYYGNYTTSVMFRQDKILWLGGQNNSSIVIDLTSGNPVLRPAGQLSSTRKWADATLLPDGRVLVTGGARERITDGLALSGYGVNNAAEIWNPATRQWTVGDSGQHARLYHSTSLLLADGRVLVAGGGNPGPVRNTNAEIYSPDYLVQRGGAPTVRPTINSISRQELDPGVIVSLGVDSPGQIDRVTLVKTGSVTHSFDMDQRFVELDFGRWPGEIRARIPGSSNVVTPGNYLLTVIDADGIPSTSEIVSIGSNHVSTVNQGKQFAPEVYRLYLGVFGRAPEADGLKFWSAKRAAGAPLQKLAAEYAKSAEFRNKYGSVSNGQYVDLIYQNILNRPPQQAGHSYWTFQLRSGKQTRAQLMRNFTESAELANQLGPIS